MLLCFALFASENGWQKLWSSSRAAGSAPRARTAESIAVWNDYLVVYGGFGEMSNYDYLNDLWLFDIMTRRWTAVPQSSKITPNPRHGHSAVVHTLDDNVTEMVVFGGFERDSFTGRRVQTSNAVWTFNLYPHLGKWTQQATRGSSLGGPSPRTEQVAVLWDKHSLVMFGGVNLENGAVDFDDLWTLDLITWQWKKLLSSATTTISRPSTTTTDWGGGWPPSRFSHAGCLMHSSMTFLGPNVTYPADTEDWFVIFGGRHIISPRGRWSMLDDLWVFSMQRLLWKRVPQVPPFKRAYHSIVALHNALWIFGGYSFQQTNGEGYVFNEVLKCELASNQAELQRIVPLANASSGESFYPISQSCEWSQMVTDDTNAPSMRFDHRAIVWHSSMLVYGGRFSVWTRDLWALNLSNPFLAFEPARLRAKKNGFITVPFLLTTFCVVSLCLLAAISMVRRRRHAGTRRGVEIQETGLGGLGFADVTQNQLEETSGLDQQSIDLLPMVKFSSSPASSSRSPDRAVAVDVTSPMFVAGAGAGVGAGAIGSAPLSKEQQIQALAPISPPNPMKIDETSKKAEAPVPPGSTSSSTDTTVPCASRLFRIELLDASGDRTESAYDVGQSHVGTTAFGGRKSQYIYGQCLCAICLVEFEEEEELRQLPCLHSFHSPCIDEWLYRNRYCPLCKQDSTPRHSSQISLSHDASYGVDGSSAGEDNGDTDAEDGRRHQRRRTRIVRRLSPHRGSRSSSVELSSATVTLTL